MSNFFKYNFRIFLRNREQIMWNTLFPLIYMLIFVMAMQNLGSGSEKMPSVRLAIVEDKEAPSQTTEIKQFPQTMDLKSFFAAMGDSAAPANLSDDGLVMTETSTKTNTKEPLILYRTAASYDEAIDWLKNKYVYAVLQEKRGEMPKIEVLDKNAELEPIILSQVMKSYGENNAQMKIYQEAFQEGRMNKEDMLKIMSEKKGLNPRKLDTEQRQTGQSLVNIFYFAMIAYLAYYPINSGALTVTFVEADKSPEAMRQAITRHSKHKRFLGNFLPYYLLVLCNVVIIFVAVQLLGVNIGNEKALVLFLMCLTSLAAMLTGTCLASIFSFSQGVLMAVSIALPLLFGMTAGMMSNEIFGNLMRKAPWVMDMNPIGMTSMALYHLNGGGGIADYWQQIVKLLIFCGGAFALTLLGLRRKSYESL